MKDKFTKNDVILLMRLINTDRLLYREVAKVMGMTEGMVSGRVTRLRAKGNVINAVGRKEYNSRFKNGYPTKVPNTRENLSLSPKIPLHLFTPRQISKSIPMNTPPPIPPSLLLKKRSKFSYLNNVAAAVVIGAILGAGMILFAVPASV